MRLLVMGVVYAIIFCTIEKVFFGVDSVPIWLLALNAFLGTLVALVEAHFWRNYE